MSTADFVLTPQDEYPHAAGPEINFNESVYTNAFDAQTGTGGWMRIGNRVNEGHAELSVCLYLPDGRIACQFQRPSIASNSAFDAGGLSVETPTPWQTQIMRFSGEVMLLANADALRDPEAMFKTAERVPAEVEWHHEGLVPPHGGVPARDDVRTMYGRDFSFGHFNQHTRARGHITIAGVRHAIDGFGWRDHSWGPRYWTDIVWYRLFLATFPDGRALMLLKRADRSGQAFRRGVLMVDHRYEDIQDLDIFTSWDGQKDPAEMRITARTASHKAIITARVRSCAPLRNRRKIDGVTLINRIAEAQTEFTWDGVTATGMSEYIERIEDGEPVGWPL